MSVRTAIIVSPHPESGVGGVERICALIAEALGEDGWRVQIVGPAREPSRWTARAGGTWLALSRSAMRPLRDRDADLLITNGFFGWPRGPRAVPRIHIFHGTMVGHGWRGDVGLPIRERARRVFGGGVAEAAAGRAATVVAVSDDVARQVARYYRIAVDRVVEQGVDTAAFHPADRGEARARLGLPAAARLALYVGRVQVLKGTDAVVAACRAAGYEALVAGPEPLPGARWLGPLAPAELASAYAAADAVLCPSRYEGAQLVPLEALAVGTPVVASPVGWIPTLVRAVPAYRRLVARTDAADIAAALARVDDPDAREAVAAAHRLVVERHDLGAFKARWRRLAAEVSS